MTSWRTIRTLCASLAALGLSILGYGEATGPERFAFVAGGVLFLALAVAEARQVGTAARAARYEPKTVRWFCHRAFEQIAALAFPDEGHIRITAYVLKPGETLVPIVCFDRTDPYNYEPVPEPPFRSDSATLSQDALQNPGKIVWYTKPRFDDLAKARQWFGEHLKLSSVEAQQLSVRTLRSVTAVACIGLPGPPHLHERVVGLVTILSESGLPLGPLVDESAKDLMRAVFETVATMLVATTTISPARAGSTIL